MERGRYGIEAGRFAFYGHTPDSKFWDDVWHAKEAELLWRRAAKGWLPRQFARTFERHLPTNGKLLEAGCGLGHVVLGLRARGYDAEGIDWAADTVQRLTQMRPDIPVRVGDVRALDVPDGHYAGYISLGVMEHFRDGPGVVLREAARVLRPGGVIVASVPFENAVRTRLRRTAVPLPDGLPFYQFAFSKDEFCSLTRAAGFEIEEVTYYNVVSTLRDHFPKAARALRAPGAALAVGVLGSLIPGLLGQLGHMMIVTGRRS
jgi:SAM-dependent methyltransferase